MSVRGRHRSPPNATTKLRRYAISGAIQSSGIVATFWLMWFVTADNSSEPHDLYQKLITELERPLIQVTLKRARGNQVHAARILGLNRNTLRKKLVEHGIPITKLPA